MRPAHPLLDAEVLAAVERAASQHLGRPWMMQTFLDLNDRSSHPCGILGGDASSVFAKLATGPDGQRPFTAELAGLSLLGASAAVLTATPIGAGVVAVPDGYVLLLEALPERGPLDRTAEDWRAIGRTLATLHQVRGPRFGLDGTDGFFGPLHQDNRPVAADTWAAFYGERRVAPLVRSAVESGHLPPEIAGEVDRLLLRLPSLCGPEPAPSLLHGDAQHHNFVSTDRGAVIVDAAPYFGHPEIDLALVDYFEPVPRHVLDGYRDIAPVDAGFAERRELWRIFGYLAIVTVDGAGSFGRRFLDRLAQAVRAYR